MVSDRMTRSRSLSKILCQKFFWIQFGVSGSGIGFLGVSVRRSMVVLEFSFFEIGPHYVWGYKTCYKFQYLDPAKIEMLPFQRFTGLKNFRLRSDCLRLNHEPR